MGTVISFINLKGGVGKTTCCANIAGEFSNSHKKVLVIDMDAQANISTLLMGSDNYSRKILLADQAVQSEDEIISNTVYQLFRDEIYEQNHFSFDRAIVKSVNSSNQNLFKLTYLDLLPASHHLQTLEQNIVNYDRTKFIILNKALKKIKKQYDLILIDCPPNIYTATKNSLYASDYYIIPTSPEYLSFSGIPLLVNQLNKIIEIKQEETANSIKLMGILLNMVDHKRLNVHKEGIEKVKNMLSIFKQNKIVDQYAIVFDTMISQRAPIKKAAGNFVPICIDDPRSESTGQFKLLCTEILKHINSNYSKVIQ